MNLQPYLTFARQLAYRAGRITLSYYNKGIQHDLKPDESPVTAADHATEEFIRSEIERAYPSHAIMGEEFGEKAGEDNPFRWIVDPIDGTKSFMKGVPFYSVLIALEIEGVSRVGAVCFPALDEILCAADGLGCWWNGKRARVSDVRELKQAVFSYTSWSGFLTTKRLKVFQRFHKDTRNASMGAAGAMPTDITWWPPAVPRSCSTQRSVSGMWLRSHPSFARQAVSSVRGMGKRGTRMVRHWPAMLRSNQRFWS
jgi:fructose-1,6-bisphosphatase/inositol monophosphatase family enzyme